MLLLNAWVGVQHWGGDRLGRIRGLRVILHGRRGSEHRRHALYLAGAAGFHQRFRRHRVSRLLVPCNTACMFALGVGFAVVAWWWLVSVLACQ